MVMLNADFLKSPLRKSWVWRLLAGGLARTALPEPPAEPPKGPAGMPVGEKWLAQLQIVQRMGTPRLSPLDRARLHHWSPGGAACQMIALWETVCVQRVNRWLGVGPEPTEAERLEAHLTVGRGAARSRWELTMLWAQIIAELRRPPPGIPAEMVQPLERPGMARRCQRMGAMWRFHPTLRSGGPLEVAHGLVELNWAGCQEDAATFAAPGNVWNLVGITGELIIAHRQGQAVKANSHKEAEC